MQKVLFHFQKKEQAVVGQSLTILALRERKGCLENPPGVLLAADGGRIKEKGTLDRVVDMQICACLYSCISIGQYILRYT